MKKNNAIINIEVIQRDDPASGIHLLVDAITKFAKEYANTCGYEIRIAKEFN